MQGPEKNSYKEFDNEKKFLRLENSPPPPSNYFFDGPSLKSMKESEKARELLSPIFLRAGGGC